MLTHASQVNRRAFDEKYGSHDQEQPSTDAVWNDKPFEELTSAEYADYIKAGMS